MMMRTLTIMGCAAAFGCGAFDDEPYLIRDLRVVAVVADPPEVHPAEPAAITAYVADPRDPEGWIDAAWSFCNRRGAMENQRDCGSGAVALPIGRTDRILSGVFVSDTVHAVQAEDLADVPPLIMQAGFWEHVRLHVIGGNDQIEATKRVVVIAPERLANANPVLSGVEVRQGGVLVEGPLRAAAGSVLTLSPLYDPAAFESYFVLGADGGWQSRVEEAVFSWYVTGGELNRWVTRDATPIRWTLPEESGALQLFCVLRDSRGGSAVWVADVVLE